MNSRARNPHRAAHGTVRKNKEQEDSALSAERQPTLRHARILTSGYGSLSVGSQDDGAARNCRLMDRIVHHVHNDMQSRPVRQRRQQAVVPPASDILRTLDRKVDPRHCALLVIDMQNDFLHEQGKARREGARNLDPMLEIVPRQSELIRAARTAGVPVIFVLQTTLAEQASSSDVWIEARTRARYSGQDMCLDGSWGQEIISELKPEPVDHYVKKYRYSGFVGTNLDLLLRSLNRRTVICAGTSTNVCVEATAWDAFHHEYYVVYAADACASWDMTLHASALTTAENRYATVAPVSDLIGCWHDQAKQ